MSRYWTLIKMNLRVLLRNKGLLFFLFATPILSTLILASKVETEMEDNKGDVNSVLELASYEEKAVYCGDTSTYIVKVYDGCGSDLSEYVLKNVAMSGMFSVCRCDVSDLSEEEVEELAKRDAFEDRCGALLYIKPDFDQAILKDNYEAAFLIYPVSDDERIDLFDTEMRSALNQIQQTSSCVGTNSEKILEVLNDIEEYVPTKEVVNYSGKDEIYLTDAQHSHKQHIGYAVSIITLGFLFCGVIVAHTVIEEQNNKVYTRVMLTKLSRGEYFFVKANIALIISVIQTAILGICLFAGKGIDFGIDKWSFLLVILCIGFIFSLLSLMMGVLIGDVMSANYATFALWSISALLAGLYFSLETTSPVLKALSWLMPQRWFMRASELLLVGDNSAYSMILYVTVAYLVFSLSVGSIGLKMKKNIN